MPIPKIISFIWVGRSKALPEESHKNIEKWREENKDFQAILWVSRPLLEEFRKIYESRGYQFAFSDPEDNKDNKNNKNPIDIEKLIASTVRDDAETGPTVVADIEILFKKALDHLSKDEVDKLRDIIYYQMNNFTPNYGTSSDLLRYLVLLVYGGAYFDSDVPCLGKLSDEPPYKDKDNDVKSKYFTLPEYSQGTLGIGNDAFVCSPGHEVTKNIIQSALKNFSPNNFFADQFETFMHHMSTVSNTGPHLINRVLREYPELAKESGMFEAIPKENAQLFPKDWNHIPKAPAGKSWVDPPPTQCKGVEESIQAATSSMAVEARYLKVGRFSDHIYHIGRSLKQLLLTALTEDLFENNGYKTFITQLISKTKDKEYLCGFNSKKIQKFLVSELKILPDTAERIYSKLEKKMQLPACYTGDGSLKNILNSKYFATILIEENLMAKFKRGIKIPEKITIAYRDVLQATKPLRGTADLTESDEEIIWEKIDDFLACTSPHNVNNYFNSTIAQNLTESLQRNNLLNILQEEHVKHARNDAQYLNWQKTLNNETTIPENKKIVTEIESNGSIFEGNQIFFNSTPEMKKNRIQDNKTTPDKISVEQENAPPINHTPSSTCIFVLT